MDRLESRRALLLLRAGEQREMVRWWAAECRARNAACRRRFSTAHVAAATEARRILRRYAAAWSETRGLIRGIGIGIGATSSGTRSDGAPDITKL